MPRNHHSSSSHQRLLRTRLAHEAARWIVASSLHDYPLARRKIARRHGIRNPADLPHDDEILAALVQHQRVFSRAEDRRAVQRLRAAARDAMQFFKHFHPRLVGPVRDGTAHARTPIELHVHTDDTDAVQHFLEENAIKARLRSHRIYLTRARPLDILVWHFQMDDMAFHVAVLPDAALRQAPLSPDGRRPMARASMRQMSDLFACSPDNDSADALTLFD